MIQLNKSQIILFHLYPGVVITVGFSFLAPVVIGYAFPPQFAMLISIVLIALPLLIGHLLIVKKQEHQTSLAEVNGLTNRLPMARLIFYSIGLVAFAFFIWGLTQPVNLLITQHLLGWLPDWYTVQDLNGYSDSKIKLTLLFNLVLNGAIAPFVEELYFRGYLLPRMKTWGKKASLINTVLFSFYHFWQPYVYLTLILALLPLTYLTWKTNDIRLAIVAHCLLNLVGALLSFGVIL